MTEVLQNNIRRKVWEILFERKSTRDIQTKICKKIISRKYIKEYLDENPKKEYTKENPLKNIRNKIRQRIFGIKSTKKFSTQNP